MNTLVLDISSNSINVGVVRNLAKNLPEVKQNFYLPVYTKENQTQDILARNLILKTEDALKHLDKSQNIEKIVLSFSNEITDSIIKEKMVRETEDIVCKYFGIKKGINIESTVDVFCKVIFKSFNNPSSLQILLNGESIELQFVHFGKSGSYNSLSIGINSFIRRIALEMNVPDSVASSYLSLYSEGLLDSKATLKIESIVKYFEKEIISMWEKTEHFKIDSHFDIYVLTDSGYESVGKSLIQGIFPNLKTQTMGLDNLLLNELIKFNENELINQKIALLGAFSNLLY